MEDKVLFRLALICSFLGLGVLLMIYDRVDLPLTDFSNLEDGYVKVEGEIGSVYTNPGMYILKLTDGNGTLSVVVFSENRIGFERGDVLEVEGELEEYKGDKEIIASKILLL
jgi:RecJ-like exonuclease